MRILFCGEVHIYNIIWCLEYLLSPKTCTYTVSFGIHFIIFGMYSTSVLYIPKIIKCIPKETVHVQVHVLGDHKYSRHHIIYLTYIWSHYYWVNTPRYITQNSLSNNISTKMYFKSKTKQYLLWCFNIVLWLITLCLRFLSKHYGWQYIQ